MVLITAVLKEVWFNDIDMCSISASVTLVVSFANFSQSIPWCGTQLKNFFFCFKIRNWELSILPGLKAILYQDHPFDLLAPKTRFHCFWNPSISVRSWCFVYIWVKWARCLFSSNIFYFIKKLENTSLVIFANLNRYRAIL